VINFLKTTFGRATIKLIKKMISGKTTIETKKEKKVDHEQHNFL